MGENRPNFLIFTQFLNKIAQSFEVFKPSKIKKNRPNRFLPQIEHSKASPGTWCQQKWPLKAIFAGYLIGPELVSQKMRKCSPLDPFPDSTPKTPKSPRKSAIFEAKITIFASKNDHFRGGVTRPQDLNPRNP